MMAEDFAAYAMCLPALEAHEKLWALQASSYPYQKDGDRRRLVSEINKITKLHFDVEGDKIVSTQDAALELAKRMMSFG